MAKYKTIFTVKRLWLILIASMVVMFSVLLYFGNEIYQEAPPIPSTVVSTQGDQVFTAEEITRGQNVWQSLGGMQKGSIWGHGSYLAPDWSADWLHREAETMLVLAAAKQYDTTLDGLTVGQLETLKTYLRIEMKQNTYDATTQRLVLSDDRIKAIEQVKMHYAGYFPKHRFR